MLFHVERLKPGSLVASDDHQNRHILAGYVTEKPGNFQKVGKASEVILFQTVLLLGLRVSRVANPWRHARSFACRSEQLFRFGIGLDVSGRTMASRAGAGLAKRRPRVPRETLAAARGF